MRGVQVFARLDEVANWDGMSKSHFEKEVQRLVQYCGSKHKLHLELFSRAHSEMIRNETQEPSMSQGLT